MDPRRNPYAPGAGAPPPELAGRDTLIEDAAIALDRIRNGLTAKSMLLVGLRGVGKTVLLNRICRDAECRGFTTVLLEAPEDRSLPELLVPPLYAAMVRMSRLASASRAVHRALQALAGFVSAIKIGAGDLNVSLDLFPERGLADSGDLDADLTALIESVGEAARDRQTALALFIDELQYVSEPELAALIAALHRAAQRQLPVTLVGAGLPQLVARTRSAKSYAKRLFTFPVIGALDGESAKRAIETPAERLGVGFGPDTLDAVLNHTSCYPYFLQQPAGACRPPTRRSGPGCPPLQAARPASARCGSPARTPAAPCRGCARYGVESFIAKSPGGAIRTSPDPSVHLVQVAVGYGSGVAMADARLVNVVGDVPVHREQHTSFLANPARVARNPGCVRLADGKPPIVAAIHVDQLEAGS